MLECVEGTQPGVVREVEVDQHRAVVRQMLPVSHMESVEWLVMYNLVQFMQPDILVLLEQLVILKIICVDEYEQVLQQHGNVLEQTQFQ